MKLFEGISKPGWRLVLIEASTTGLLNESTHLPLDLAYILAAAGRAAEALATSVQALHLPLPTQRKSPRSQGFPPIPGPTTTHSKGFTMVNSQVPKVQLTLDGKIVLTVQVAGFAEGKSVEISGYLTQDVGVYASFHVTRDLPKPNAGVAEVEVPLSSKELELDETKPVTVVTSVSEVWPSMLTVATSTSNGFKTEWEIDTAATERWRSKSGATSGGLKVWP